MLKDNNKDGGADRELAEFFPVWDKLSPPQRELISSAAFYRRVKAGTMLHSGSADCMGLLVIRSGQLRAYILSDEGREITIYRLFERDICLMSASCMMRNIQFEISIEAEKDSGFWVIPPQVYKTLMDESAAVANYTGELMSSRFSEVMWLIEQVMWKSFDKRLADFLLRESALDGTDVLRITHERIANHMGTAREVVTRMLRYFQDEGMVKLSRGLVEITDSARLRSLAEE
ncbi:MAG: Crp/Fnr family transcriptional regulator [Candidatus Heteroscillospira sp.]|jgi:CRP/FNR family transcriptional regulator